MTEAAVLPDLRAFPPEWLASAEVSVALSGSSRAGVSFFFTETSAFERFCAEAALPPAVLDEDRRLRSELPLAPRHWVKLHARGGVFDGGVSRYFAVHPAFTYPIATIRLFCRRHGAPTAALEAMLRPALERPETLFILTLKPGADPRPRVSCRVPRPLLPELLTRDFERAYREWDARIEAGPFLYVTVDPRDGGVSSVDFEDVAEGSLPAGWRDLGLPVRPRYLKCRVSPGTSEPEWVLYASALAR